MFSSNFWHLLVGIVINNMWALSTAAWECLMVEDAPRRRMAPIYPVRWLSFILPGPTVLLAGLLVRRAGVITGTRLIFAGAAVLMSTGVLLRQMLLAETRPRDTVRTAEVSYAEALGAIVRNRAVLLALVLQALTYAGGMVGYNFLPLYYTDPNGLNLPEGVSAALPTTASTLMLLGVLAAAVLAGSRRSPRLVCAGAALVTAGVAAVSLLPAGSLLLAALAVTASGFGAGLARPSQEAVLGLVVPPRLRAKIMGISYTLAMGAGIVGGPVAGAVFRHFGARPFAGMLAGFYGVLFMLALLAMSRRGRAAAAA